MQIALLKDIVGSVAGEKAKGIVDLLALKKNVNEFLIAKKLGLTINQTRNILYKLADEGLVSFVRKKDTKKGGWYTYFWTLNHDKSLFKFKDNLMKRMEELNQQKHKKKTERFFGCPNCDIEFNEEAALLNDYTCPECGETLVLKDNSKEIAALEKEVAKMQSVLQEIESELQTIQVKDLKSRQRRFKAEEKKKKTERDVRRKKRIKEMMKLKGKKPDKKNDQAKKVGKFLNKKKKR